VWQCLDFIVLEFDEWQVAEAPAHIDHDCGVVPAMLDYQA